MLNWYWINFRDARNIHYLIAAESGGEAVSKIAIPMAEVFVSSATWRSIEKATGSRIPYHAKADDNATGCIPFSNEAMSIMLWPG